MNDLLFKNTLVWFQGQPYTSMKVCTVHKEVCVSSGAKQGLAVHKSVSCHRCQQKMSENPSATEVSYTY